MSEPKKLDWALGAVARGLPVFPAKGKVPYIRDWPNRASLDRDVVRRWWDLTPDADIGVALPDDIYVLDGDTEEAAATALSHFPRTLTVRTSKGVHCYFRTTQRLARVSGAKGVLGVEGLEGKSAPGPVTWVGSEHPNGSLYELERDAPIACMPAYLEDWIGTASRRGPAADATTDELERWAARAVSVRVHAAAHLESASKAARMARVDGIADLCLANRSLRQELRETDTGWADRFFRAAAMLGAHVASGALAYDSVIATLTELFMEIDSRGDDPSHVLRSIRRGVVAGAREAEAL